MYPIDPVDRVWNSDLVGSLFSGQEAERVLDIALFIAHSDNDLVWDCSRNGVYSVKFAYYGCNE